METHSRHGPAGRRFPEQRLHCSSEQPHGSVPLTMTSNLRGPYSNGVFIPGVILNGRRSSLASLSVEGKSREPSRIISLHLDSFSC
jgi:hypothetical protein